MQARLQQRLVLVWNKLVTCFHVDLVHRPLQQPYECTFSVISCHDKAIKVDQLGRFNTITIAHLKVAHFGIRF